MDLINYFKDKKVYHVSDSDLDGVGCRVVAEYYLKPVCFYLPYNTADRSLPDFKHEVAAQADIIIFTDITPPSIEFYEKLKEHSRVFIFDHHQSGKDILGNLEDYYFDITRCGTRIFYEELLQNRRKKPIIDQFVTLVDTYDCWRNDSPLWDNAKGLHNSMYSYVDWRKVMAKKSRDATEDNDRFIDAQLTKFKVYDNFFFTDFEKRAIIKGLQKEEDNYKQARKSLQIRKDNENNPYAYIECTAKASLVAHRIMKDLGESIYYLAVHSTWEKGNTKLSLRSHDFFDVTCIAEKWGGGGHKNASGMEFSNPNDFINFREGKIHLI